MLTKGQGRHRAVWSEGLIYYSCNICIPTIHGGQAQGNFAGQVHSKWLSLLMVVTIVYIVMLYSLAFSAWPSQHDTLKKQGYK